MFNHEVYDLTQRLQFSLYTEAMAAFRKRVPGNERELEPLLQLRRGYAESPAWVMAQVMEFLPEPLTVEKFRARAVYSAPSLVQALLELLASEKWLDRREDEYFLTDEGQQVFHRLQRSQQQVFAAYVPVDLAGLERLEGLMRRVVEASMGSEVPPGSWCLAHSRNRSPDESAPTIYRLIHYCTDLNAFRDDAHMAAFHPLDVKGHIWEAFSFVFRGAVHDAGDLFDQLAYRGYSCLDWDAALANLENRGWIRSGRNGFEVTAHGRKVWKDVEQRTDMYFYNPWLVLSAGERGELVSLMRQFCEINVAEPSPT